jgi:rhomboid protease GluP
MFKRQRTGSVVCPSCGLLVGVNDATCYSCGRRNPGLWGFGRSLRDFGNDLGFISLVTYGCIVLYLATLVFSVAVTREDIMRGSIFSFFGPGPLAAISFGASGMLPVLYYGHWWSILSAGWLHAGVLHLFFNMMMLRELGPATADIYGAARMVIVYVAGGAMGFLLSTIAGVFVPPSLPIIGPGSMTLGASAPIFGLLGALMYYSRRGGSSLVRSAVMGYVMSAVMFGIVMQGIDNYAHGGGFLGGYLAGRWLDPLKPERTDHIVWAGVCLFLSALAVAASVVSMTWPTIMRLLGGPQPIVF